MTEPTCAATVGCKRRPAIGLLTCRGHLDRLGALLRDVEDEAAILSAVPSMQIRAGSGGGSLASERAPARLDVLAVRDPQTRRWTRDETARHPLPAPKAFGPWCLFCDHDTCTDWRAGRRRDLHDDEHDAGSDRLMSILGILHSWARVVREDRNLADPDRITITGERATLTRHLDWCAAQPFIDEMYTELTELAGALKALNGTLPDKPVGRCYLPADDGPCNGIIRRAGDTGRPWIILTDRCVQREVETFDGHAYCERCGRTWDGPQLAMLNFEMDRQRSEMTRPRTSDGRRMLTAEEMVKRGLMSSVNNVRVTAHRRGIASVDGHYDPEMFGGKVSA